jgi:DNA ligase-1
VTNLPLSERRSRLLSFYERCGSSGFGVSSELKMTDWVEADGRQKKSRDYRVEGLMVKRREAPYVTGRKRGIWYKWKVDPLTLDVVLSAAQPGTGRRASLYTDYTFGIWRGDSLVPIAKAYSGLNDAEILELDGWIRKNTLERFGPVRMLKPERVFEIGFEGIAESSRHKSGYALRFPRILRERLDKTAVDADRVETVAGIFRALGNVPRG